MQRLITMACAGLLAAAVVTPSFAADLPRPAYKAAPAVYVAPFSWSGFYVGLNAGSSWTNVTLGGTTGDFNTKGAVFGATLGYNLQTGSWVWGLEGDFDVSTIKGSESTLCGAGSCETKNTWLATARGRVGYAYDRWLPYFTGGLAMGNVKMTTPAATSQSTTRTGYALGVGVEYAFMGPWSAKAEYLYADLGKAKCDIGACGGASSFEATFKTNLLRFGVNYRF
jgi:outer membrane immunogenic protein